MSDEYQSRVARKKEEALQKQQQQQANNEAPTPKQPKQKRSWVRWLLIILLLVVAAIAVVGGTVLVKSKSAVDNAYKPAHVKKARDVNEVLKEGKPFSILLLGTDTGELGRDYKGRTDSMMLVTVNPKQNKTTIMSIPRDTLVAVPGYENKFPTKINSAYDYGSAATTIKTVQNWLNVPVDFYALVNMNGLEKVVDQVGGIQVKSPLTFGYNPDTAHADPGNLYSFTKGSTTFTHTGKDGVKHTYNTMDGDAALAFSRMRYDDPQGDYGRQERQRMVMQGILDKIKSNPTKILSSSFIEQIGKSTQTDLTFGDAMRIGTKYVGAAKSVKSDHIQGNGYNLSSGSTEVVYRDEQQRATNVLRQALGLSQKQTGNLYSGSISDSDIVANGVPTLTQSEQLSTSSDQDKANDVAPQTSDTATGSTNGMTGNQ